MKRSWKRGALVLVAGGLAACAPVAGQEEESRLAQARQRVGGIVLESNVIRGQARLTNENPEVVALLEAERRLGVVLATSSQPAGYVGRAEVRDAAGLRAMDFELTVEAGAGGPDGVLYTVAPQWDSRHAFQPAREVRVRPLGVQPQPTEVRFEECLGVVQVRFGTDATCAQPVAVKEVTFGGRTHGSPPPGGLNHYVYTPGGPEGPRVSDTSRLVYRVGTRADLDLRSYEEQVPWSVGCDEVVRVCVPVPGPGEVGALTGPWQVEGEQPRLERYVTARFGPADNYRTQKLTRGPLESPTAEPSSWWTLPHLPPGDYTLQSSGFLRQGRELTWFRTSEARPVTVQAEQTTVVRDGLGRHAFDMHPAYMHGSIRLADPYLAAHPGADSSLRALFFEADHDSDADGIADYPYHFLTVSRYGTSLRAGARGQAFSATSFPGGFDLGKAELRSSYQHVLPNTYDAPTTWTQELLRLGFWTQGGTFYTKPGLYDEARFRYGWLDLAQQQGRMATLEPGQQHRVDHEYCFNEVQVELSTAGQRFFNPTLAVKGLLLGTDWRGAATHYTARGSFQGTPAAVGVQPAEALQYAQSRGSVRLALPQGSFTLGPGATLVNPNGTVNSATFEPLQVTVGCGQRLKLVPPLVVNLHPLEACAASGTVTVSGRVNSSPAEVDRIWYQLNDGPEVTVCTWCGLDPTFSFPVDLQACNNTVRVFAHSEGLPAPAEAFQHLVWDDPADGPTCAGSTCLNWPPVARCRDVTVPGGEVCRASVPVDDGSYDPEGEELHCTQTPDPVEGSGPHRVTLTCTDPQGASGSCQATVTVTDELPPALSCPAPTRVECAGPQGAWVTPPPASATDTCSSVSVTGPAAGLYPPGLTPVEYLARDSWGNAARCTSTIEVVPAALEEAPAPLSLWPPNHKHHTISLADCGIRDSCGGTPDLSRLAITCVSSDEPLDDSGDGRTEEDIILVDATTVRLRPERAQPGDGRVYRIHYTLTGAGGTSEGVCRVGVPPSGGHTPAVAGPPVYSVCRAPGPTSAR